MPMLALPIEMMQPPVTGAKLISRQGPRRNAWHHGIDLSVVAGERSVRGADIRPIAIGTVERVCLFPDNCCGGYGSTVLVKHADDLFSFYAHMDRVDVTEGQVVGWTTVLGVVGDKFANFRAEGCPQLEMVPHLHLEIRHADGTRYDALQVLAATGLKIGQGGMLEVAEPFDYEEPRLAGAVEKGEDIIVGSPVLRWGRWYTIGLPVGISAGVLALAMAGIWLTRRKS